MKIIKALLLLMMVVTVSSCSKDDQQPSKTYTITANVGGTLTNFDTITSATGSTNGVMYTIIQGRAVDGSTLSITLSGDVVAGKTFTGATLGGSQLMMQYSSGGVDYLNAGAGSNVASVTVTEASKTYVAGTFKGDLTTAASGSGTATTKAITSGVFSCSLK